MIEPACQEAGLAFETRERGVIPNEDVCPAAFLLQTGLCGDYFLRRRLRQPSCSGYSSDLGAI